MSNLFNENDAANANKPDFSEIDSNEKAIQLFEQGGLQKMYLMPLEFGGADSPVNYLYVPQFAVDLKQRFDAMITGLLEDGKKLSYEANPGYKGDSFIPSKISLNVNGEASFSETIEIW